MTFPIRAFLLFAFAVGFCAVLLFRYFDVTPPLIEEESVVMFTSADAMRAVHAPTPPLFTNADAANYAFHVPGLIALLEAAQSSANYTGWLVRSRRRQSGQLWEVEIRSRGYMPSFSCRLAFTRDGTSFMRGQDQMQCGYAK